ncbi:uncharacterized protein EI90DRAFT_3021571 [Cantharellus anzutake]|uniref:uncharacterized protein n=1 Tax=Cantharellus anzutake TaxID=1750568 RepID=UPI0019055D06|nr:uncharacterized protein EI90DRAFT_3021564 [Cantharellus anzutake]XP_038909162.1 uncharacterized protein EI90DRAFT_3021571 [Cantharellus anzutake]KAF8316480.1 hypothetical protein EI90DRAFT_3021564 [Cantharellus anzutake]KAF8316490.1 hypothetical protein EI90DRAFT_3021571 [Cantharellus anzutake]
MVMAVMVSGPERSHGSACMRDCGTVKGKIGENGGRVPEVEELESTAGNAAQFNVIRNSQHSGDLSDDEVSRHSSNDEEWHSSDESLSHPSPLYPANDGPTNVALSDMTTPLNIPLIYPAQYPGYIEENIPDPFTPMVNDAASLCSYSASHSHVAVWILYLMAAWLHSYHHVSFRVIGAVLSIVHLILLAAQFALDDSFIHAMTLSTVHSHMSLEPAFQILLVCLDCHKVYPALSSVPELCQKCQENNKTVLLFSESSGKTTGKAHQPRLRFAFKSLSEQLHDLLSRPGMESLLDKWRRLPGRRPEAGLYQDIFDSAVPRSILDPDGQPFFRNGLGNETGPNHELHIGLMMVEW